MSGSDEDKLTMKGNQGQEGACNLIVTKKSQESPYILAQNQTIGRFLIAAKDLERGDLILEEMPIALAPIRNSQLICPGCYSENPQENCPECGWPLCNLNCSGMVTHRTIECLLLAKNKNRRSDLSFWNLTQDSLIMIRCLALKEKEPTKWNDLASMESNWDQWCASPLFDRAKVQLKIIREIWGLSEEKFSDLEILQINAVLDINAYEVRMSNNVNIQASYNLCRLVEHNCVSNTHRTISSETLLLNLRAAIPIKQGDHITTSYCDLLWATSERQQYLKWSKFFDCKCERCQDPAELGSFLAALQCPSCPGTAPIVPISEEKYQCQKCQKDFEPNVVNEQVQRAKKELEELDKVQTSAKVPDFEDWIKRWSIPNESSLTEKGACKLLLHPQNHLILDASHTVFLLIDSNDDAISEQDLQRKISLGMHLLNSTVNIIPGISKFRGTVMYEVAMAKITSVMRIIEESEEDIDEGSKELAKSSLQMLEDSLEMLKYEPEDQPEGALAKSGAMQFEMLQMYFETLLS